MLRCIQKRLSQKAFLSSLLFQVALPKNTIITTNTNNRTTFSRALLLAQSSKVSSIIDEGDDGTRGVSNDSFDKKTRWAREDRWDHMVEQLISYREEFGDTLVSTTYEPNPKLGTWGKKLFIVNYYIILIQYFTFTRTHRNRYLHYVFQLRS